MTKIGWAKFHQNNKKWLSESLSFKHLKAKNSTSRRNQVRKFRTQKNFSDLCISARQKKAKIVLESHSSGAIFYAARQLLKAKFGSEAGFVFNKISTQENAAKEYKKLESTKQPCFVDPDSVLAFTTKARMTKMNYGRMRKVCVKHNAKIWPPWRKVQQAKKRTLPEGIKVSDFDSIVPMQPLLNKTTERLLEDTDLQSDIKDLIETNDHGPKNPIKLSLFLKYGFDGSSNQSMYNQKASIPVKKKGLRAKKGSKTKKESKAKSEKPDDNKMVASQITVIWLAWGDKILYLNEMMNAASGCRPLRLRYGKETALSSQQEWERLENEIAELVSYSPITSIIVEFDLVPTMFDCKAENDILGIPSYAKAWPCGKNPTQFPLIPYVVCQFLNDLPFFGVSPCHALMRIFDFLLKTGYDTAFKAPYKSALHAELRAIGKKRIQDEIFHHFGVRVDEPRQNGGNSTTGNAARRCLAEPEKLAEILKIPAKLIILARTLCMAVASKSYVDLDKLHNLGQELKREFQNYFVINGSPWRKMPNTLHRIADHSRDILSKFPCPPGYLSEEGSESNNKVIRHARLFNARKTSRINNLTDITTLLLCTSDPKILKINEKDILSARKHLPPTPELEEILKNPNENNTDFLIEEDLPQLLINDENNEIRDEFVI